MSASARANEPSMEEILASIRRIISDEVAGDPRPAQPGIAPGDRMTRDSAPMAVAAPPENAGDAAPMDTGFLPPDGLPAFGAPVHGLDEGQMRVAASGWSSQRSAGEPAADADARFFAELAAGDVSAAGGGADAASSEFLSPAFPAVDLLPADAALRNVAASSSGDARTGAPGLSDLPASLRAVFAKIEATSVPETADMQLPANSAPSRPAALEAEDIRAADSPASRFPESRFAPSLRPVAPAAEAAAEAPSRLVSNITTAAVSNAFGTLARTVASNSRSVDDLVAEAVRPMLKAWLDENLPALVERLVRAEIERVSRQGQ